MIFTFQKVILKKQQNNNKCYQTIYHTTQFSIIFLTPYKIILSKYNDKVNAELFLFPVLKTIYNNSQKDKTFVSIKDFEVSTQMNSLNSFSITTRLNCRKVFF